MLGRSEVDMEDNEMVLKVPLLKRKTKCNSGNSQVKKGTASRTRGKQTVKQRDTGPGSSIEEDSAADTF